MKNIISIRTSENNHVFKVTSELDGKRDIMIELKKLAKDFSWFLESKGLNLDVIATFSFHNSISNTFMDVYEYRLKNDQFLTF